MEFQSLRRAEIARIVEQAGLDLTDKILKRLVQIVIMNDQKDDVILERLTFIRERYEAGKVKSILGYAQSVFENL